MNRVTIMFEYKCAAGLFDELTDIAAAMKSAEKNRQCWRVSSEVIAPPEGSSIAGLDIHIRIYPDGVKPDGSRIGADTSS